MCVVHNCYTWRKPTAWDLKYNVHSGHHIIYINKALIWSVM